MHIKSHFKEKSWVWWEINKCYFYLIFFPSKDRLWVLFWVTSERLLNLHQTDLLEPQIKKKKSSLDPWQFPDYDITKVRYANAEWNTTYPGHDFFPDGLKTCSANSNKSYIVDTWLVSSKYYLWAWDNFIGTSFNEPPIRLYFIVKTPCTRIQSIPSYV